MEAVRVVARIRPPSQRDLEMNNQVVVLNNTQRREVIVNLVDKTVGPKTFFFDGVYGSDAETSTIFEQDIASIAKGAVDGYNGTVFAYGQTGSGKSYTMYGGEDKQPEGIVFCALDYVYKLIAKLPEGHRTLVYCSFLEIYKEEVWDLLQSTDRRKNTQRPLSGLQIRQDANSATYAEGLKTVKTRDAKDCRKIVEKGLKMRQQAKTKMNADSSRSHAIFTMTVEVSETIHGVDRFTIGKLNFVDLAGSERQSKTENEKERQEESIKINLSLTTLGRVIQILSESVLTHIPYRDSKLTRLLENSLGGNARTVMICCVSPTDDNREETLNTLNYASRAKKIKNKPVVNTDPKNALLKEYLERIRKLEEQLALAPNIEEELRKEGDRIRDQLRQEHLKEIQQLEEKQERTLLQFEERMTKASEDEKQLLIAEKDQEIQRIQTELNHRQKEEFKRLEMRKAEEYQIMEDKLRNAIEMEKGKIQNNLELELKSFKDEAEQMRAKLRLQKVEMENKRKTNVAQFENKLCERLTAEHEGRMNHERQQLEEQYSLRLQDERSRLEEQAQIELDAIKVTSLRELESEKRRLLESKAQELQRIAEEKDIEIKRMRDEIKQGQEEEFRRISAEHAKIMPALIGSPRNSQDAEVERRMDELEKRLNVEREAQIQISDGKHRAGMEDNDSDYRKNDSLKSLQQNKNLEEQLRAMVSANKQVVASFEGRMVEQAEKASQELNQARKEFERQIRKLEEEHRLVLQENEKRIKEQNQADEEAMQTRARKNQSELQALDKKLKATVVDKSNVETQIQQLRAQNTTLRSERDRALYSLDEYEQNHIGCQEIQEDQQQKNKELESEIINLQKQLAKERLKKRSDEGNCPVSPILDQSVYEQRSFPSTGWKTERSMSGSKTYRISENSIVFDNRLQSPVLQCQSRVSASSGQTHRRMSQSSLRPLQSSNSRRQALIQAVAGVTAENFLSSAKEEYERQLDQYVQIVQDKEHEIRCLKKELEISSSRTETSDLKQVQVELTKQEQVTLLYQQILTSVVPHLPDSNYKDVNRIAKSAVWNNVAQKWRLQPLTQSPSEIDGDDCDLLLIDNHWSNPPRDRELELGGKGLPKSGRISVRRSANSVTSLIHRPLHSSRESFKHKKVEDF